MPVQAKYFFKPSSQVSFALTLMVRMFCARSMHQPLCCRRYSPSRRATSPLQAFAVRLPNLRMLSLANSSATDAAVSRLSASFPELCALDLSNCEALTNDALEMIGRKLPQLRHLCLQGCRDGMCPGSECACVRACLLRRDPIAPACPPLPPRLAGFLRQLSLGLHISLPRCCHPRAADCCCHPPQTALDTEYCHLHDNPPGSAFLMIFSLACTQLHLHPTLAVSDRGMVALLSSCRLLRSLKVRCGHQQHQTNPPKICPSTDTPPPLTFTRFLDSSFIAAPFSAALCASYPSADVFCKL